MHYLTWSSHCPFVALCSLNSQANDMLMSLLHIIPCSFPYILHYDYGNSVSPSLSIWAQALICVSFVPSLTSVFLTNFPCFYGLIPHSLLISSFQNPLSVISSASASPRAFFNINMHESYTNQDIFINVT